LTPEPPLKFESTEPRADRSVKAPTLVWVLLGVIAIAAFVLVAILLKGG
jgi:hypothetical protein